MNLIKNVLDNFLEFEEKRALYLKGKWGVGKTYFWKNYIREREKIHEDHYSYVSLFGAKNIKDVRGAILVNASKFNNQNKHRKWFKKSAVILPNIAKDIPLVSAYGGIIASLEHAVINKLISNYLICFDDLERRAKDLPIDEVLGLASELKEEKQCRIVFILNEDEISDTDKKSLKSYKEKVIDIEVEFNPSASENYRHVFSPEDHFYEFVLNKIQQLDLRNIRIIQRIKRNIDYIMDLIRHCERSFKEEIISHLVLISYIHSSPDCTITTDFLRKFNAMTASFAAMRKTNEVDKESQEKAGFLTNYGYTYSEYDNYIIEFIEKGILNEDELKQLISTFNQREKVAQIKKKLQDIWKIFARSFQGTEEDFTKALVAFIDEHVKQLTLQEFSEIEDLTKELELDLTKYRETVIASNLDSLSLHDLDSWLHSPYIPQAFHVEITSRIDGKKSDFNINEIFKKIANKNSWSAREIEFLAACQVDDFAEWMSAEDDTDLFYYIRQGLKFREMNSNPSYKKIGERIQKALENIGRRSRFDKLRVEKLFNVSVPDNE